MTAVYCPHCGYFIGFYTVENGQVCLATGSLIIYDVGGYCRNCRQRWYYHASDDLELCIVDNS